MRLVRGYLKQYCGGEILRAVTEDGRVFETGPHHRSDEFDNGSRKWSRIYGADMEKDGYKFIGNYPMISNVVKWA